MEARFATSRVNQPKLQTSPRVIDLGFGHRVNTGAQRAEAVSTHATRRPEQPVAATPSSQHVSAAPPPQSPGTSRCALATRRRGYMLRRGVAATASPLRSPHLASCRSRRSSVSPNSIALNLAYLENSRLTHGCRELECAPFFQRQSRRWRGENKPTAGGQNRPPALQKIHGSTTFQTIPRIRGKAR